MKFRFIDFFRQDQKPSFRWNIFYHVFKRQFYAVTLTENENNR